MDRRRLFRLGAAALASAALPTAALAADLAPLPGRPPPISRAERERRIALAQSFMRMLGVSALVIEPGASLVYFTGVQWSRSERLTCAIIPVDGEIGVVTPFFEEPSVRETLAVPADLRTWQEHEDPTALVAAWIRDRRLDAAAVGVEETVRAFILNGLQENLRAPLKPMGAAIARNCRMLKSPAEIALMQHASDITIAAYRHTVPQIRRGMTPADIGAIMNGATRALGGDPEFALILLGEASAYPHGTGKPQAVRDGEVVLMDCGCNVDGYQSDISRTLVFGEATRRQRTVWDHMRRGQEVAFETAQVGVQAGHVDDAVRRLYQSLGYGPSYRLPGLSHRTGHGIGLDGHEPVNLVRGETIRLGPGMCFSNEPGLYIPGEFGIRLEDCIHMTVQGPRWFSQPPKSLDRPV